MNPVLSHQMQVSYPLRITTPNTQIYVVMDSTEVKKHYPGLDWAGGSSTSALKASSKNMVSSSGDTLYGTRTGDSKKAGNSKILFAGQTQTHTEQFEPSSLQSYVDTHFGGKNQKHRSAQAEVHEYHQIHLVPPTLGNSRKLNNSNTIQEHGILTLVIKHRD